MTNLRGMISTSYPPNSVTKDGTKSQSNYTTVVAANPIGVRGAVKGLRETVRNWGVPQELAARVELVAAEVCNNIAEHGYKSRTPGELSLHACKKGRDLHLQISDNGNPPPSFLLESATLPSIEVAVADLPEGGFGWFLIQSEVDASRFARLDGQNHLFLRFTPRRG